VAEEETLFDLFVRKMFASIPLKGEIIGTLN
jgi:hypothetical protein